MNSLDLSNKHKQVADFYDQVYHKNSQPINAANRYLHKLAKRLSIAPGQRVLDVACGKGAWLSILYNMGLEISGLDISQNAIEACKKQMPSGQFHVGPAESMPFYNKQFDLVTCLGSLEHFLDKPKALQEMVRVTVPEGKVLILVPNSGFLTYRLGLYRGTQQQEIQEDILSLNDWDHLFTEAGLIVEDLWRDLHILNRSWILRPPIYLVPVRLLQAIALPLWPLKWQYQVFHLCRIHN